MSEQPTPALHELNEGFTSTETLNVQMSMADIVAGLKNSCSFMVNFFIEVDMHTPEFHETSWGLLINQIAQYVALAWPRAHAKTTLAKLAVVWHLLFSPRRFILYVSATATLAVSACQDILNYFRSENYKAVFGEVDFLIEQDARGLYKFVLHYMDEKGNRHDKICIVRALGAGQQVRGINVDNIRPDMAVVDDLEDDDNTATPLLQKRLKTWFYGPFIKALAKGHRLIYLGNMLSNQSLLHHFCESEEWFSVRYGCILSSGAPLWPELWSIEALRKDFIEYQRLGLTGRWFAEMMNLPVADGTLLIAAEDIYYVPQLLPGEQELSFITVDPAISQKTWADESAVVVHGIKNGLPRVLEYVKGKFTPDQLFDIIVSLCHKWNTAHVGIELAGYQAGLKYLFEILMEGRQFHFTIYEIPHKNKPKMERIAAWCGLIRKKQWGLPEGDFVMTEQLLQFDPAKKANRDDLIDAGAMGPTMTALYMPELMDQYAVDNVEYRVISGVDRMA